MRVYSMQIYFANPDDIIEHINNKVFTKTTFNKIYSKDGIFHVINNKLHRLIITDGSSENICINNIDFLIDRSSFTYDTECYQLHPQHISETVYIQTYELTDKLKLVIERSNTNTEIYFIVDNSIDYTIDYETHIRTFLSGLNLC